MAGGTVFVSWTGADKEAANALVRRLRIAGLNYYFSANRESEERIAPGENIKTELARKVANSDLFVALLSEAALASRWVQAEHTFAETGKAERQLPVIPAVVSPLGDAAVPDWMGGQNFVAGQATAEPFERVLDDLMLSICRKLGIDEPDRLRAAVLTMSQTQFDELAASDAALLTGLEKEKIRAAYPAVAGDSAYRPFMPCTNADGEFQEARSLREVVGDAVAKVNEQRRSRALVPLLVEFFNNQQLQNMSASERVKWEKNPAMIFVDALSVHHPQVKAALNAVPPDRLGQNLTIWLPLPTRSMEVRRILEGTKQILVDVHRLNPDFHRYLSFESPHPYLGFEVASEPAAKHGIHAFCDRLEGKPLPPGSPVGLNLGGRRRFTGAGLPGLRE